MVGATVCDYTENSNEASAWIINKQTNKRGGLLAIQISVFPYESSNPCICGLTMLLSRHSVGTYHETSSHATRQGTLGHSRLSLLNHCGLILASRVELVCVSQAPLEKKKFQMHRWRKNSQTFSQNPQKQGKSHHHHIAKYVLF